MTMCVHTCGMVGVRPQQHVGTRMSCYDKKIDARSRQQAVHDVWYAMSTAMEAGPPHLAGCEGPCDVTAEVWPVALAEVPPTDEPQLLRPPGILGLVQTKDKGKARSAGVDTEAGEACDAYT